VKYLLSLLLISTASFGQSQSATTITLGLFSSRSIQSLKITPLGSNAWQQSCSRCARVGIHSSVALDHLEHTMQFGGRLRLHPSDTSTSMEAAGIYTIAPTPDGLRVTLQIPSEDYVAAVLAAEAAPDEPQASLEALAIAARTFALENLRRHKAEGFDLCDSTHCQALHLGPVRPSITAAVRDTAGITLWNGTHRASIYYTQHCGGISEDATARWDNRHVPYLISHVDPYCLRHSSGAWQTHLSLSEIKQITAQQHWEIPSPITGVRILQRTGSGRVKLLLFSGSPRDKSLSASSLRFAVNRTLGWNRIRSDLYTVTLTGDGLQFNGRGYGHGVGLCQMGAFQMASEHHTSAEILSFYFPTTHPGLTSAGELWYREEVGGLTLRSTRSTEEIVSTAQDAWRHALSLFPPSHGVPHPTITLAPTTELFRQLSRSPGYMLASTHGEEVFLQPQSVLRHNGSQQSVLLHELLHVLIESESTEKAPLWLREGLTEVLAGQRFSPSAAISPATADELLFDSPSKLASQQAHDYAEKTVRKLSHRYSLPAMRRWLRDGVPSEVLDSQSPSL
jgi:stage II sporulation protein D